MTNDLDGKLSSHRSDYEIHTPDNRDYRVNTKRPQSTAELVSRFTTRFDVSNLFLSNNFFGTALQSCMSNLC